jgi:hypothetical protein
MKYLRKIACVALIGAALSAYAAEPGSQRISVGITTQGFCGLKLSWEYAITGDAYVGVFYQTSALMLFQGAFDSGEIGASAHWEHDLGKGFFAEASFEAGYRYQNQNLGFAQSLFSRQGLRAGYRAAPVAFGGDLGWDQTWLTNVRYSAFVRSAWDDRYEGCSKAPESVTLWSPATKFRIGGFASAKVANRVDLSLAGGWLATPGSYVGGFDGMMFGHFPFYADLSVRIPY